jgi:hypothetical protein
VVKLSHMVWLGCLLTMLCNVITVSAASKIEAVSGKRYELSKEHGPWMIMVASLAEPPPEYRIDGPSFVEAANELVLDLRKKGIPAYIYEQKAEQETLSTFDRNGKPVRRGVRTKDNRICVVAGNYASAEESVAQKTLAYLKNYKPKTLVDHAVFRSTPGRPGPLSGAFLTLNPMLSSTEFAQKKVDPLLLKLNSDRKYSLLSNRGKYTLVVASFYGKAKIAKPGDELNFDDIGKSLDEAGRNAETLSQALREQNLHYGRTFDAFVWHERDRSLVCVGSFTSDRDPMIRHTFEFFGERKQMHAETKVDVVMPQSLLVPESDKRRRIIPVLPVALKRGKTVEALPKHTFVFDPKPQLLLVPLSTSKSHKAD